MLNNLKFKKLNPDGTFELIDTPTDGNLLTYFNWLNLRNAMDKDKPYRWVATPEALHLLQFTVEENKEALRRLAVGTVTGSHDSKGADLDQLRYYKKEDTGDDPAA